VRSFLVSSKQRKVIVQPSVESCLLYFYSQRCGSLGKIMIVKYSYSETNSNAYYEVTIGVVKPRLDIPQHTLIAVQVRKAGYFAGAGHRFHGAAGLIEESGGGIDP
jgi:hypothetical protein